MYNKNLRFYYTITERLWYNGPIRTEQIFDLRMCEDILMYNKNLRFYYTITERLWYNCLIRTEQIFDLRMCEDILMYNKNLRFYYTTHSEKCQLTFRLSAGFNSEIM